MKLSAFYDPADFISWYKRSDNSISLSDHVLTLLFNYMDGHDYLLAHDANGGLCQVDKADDTFDEVTIVDVLETVIGWNDSLIEHAKELLELAVPKEEESLNKYLASLQKDEDVLLKAWDLIPLDNMWKGGKTA